MRLLDRLVNEVDGLGLLDRASSAVFVEHYGFGFGSGLLVGGLPTVEAEAAKKRLARQFGHLSSTFSCLTVGRDCSILRPLIVAGAR